jgi:hypothetical protein
MAENELEKDSGDQDESSEENEDQVMQRRYKAKLRKGIRFFFLGVMPTLILLTVIVLFRFNLRVGPVEIAIVNDTIFTLSHLEVKWVPDYLSSAFPVHHKNDRHNFPEELVCVCFNAVNSEVPVLKFYPERYAVSKGECSNPANAQFVVDIPVFIREPEKTLYYLVMILDNLGLLWDSAVSADGSPTTLAWDDVRTLVSGNLVPTKFNSVEDMLLHYRQLAGNLHQKRVNHEGFKFVFKYGAVFLAFAILIFAGLRWYWRRDKKIWTFKIKRRQRSRQQPVKKKVETRDKTVKSDDTVPSLSLDPEPSSKPKILVFKRNQKTP